MTSNYLTYYLNLNNDLFQRLVEEEKIKQRIHPVYENLRLFKYRPGFDFFANDPDTRLVELCRGLVWDWMRERIVANPMPKFHNHFNYSTKELESLFIRHQYLVEEKYDGSCVLLWYYDHGWHWSTLGSFESPQAEEARNMFELLISPYFRHPSAGASINKINSLDSRNTYIFEIIYPENRIVLDYGNYSDMIHIATRQKDTGAEIRERPFAPAIKRQRVIRRPLSTLLRNVKSDEFHEGVVVKFLPDELRDPLKYPDVGVDASVGRIKFKTEWYFKHSRIKQVCSSKSLIRTMIEQEKGDGSQSEEVAAALRYLNMEPLVGYVDILCNLVQEKSSVIRAMLNTRRDQAAKINSLSVNTKIYSALFCALDGKDDKMREMVWKSFEGHENDIEGAYLREKRELETLTQT